MSGGMAQQFLEGADREEALKATTAFVKLQKLGEGRKAEKAAV